MSRQPPTSDNGSTPSPSAPAESTSIHRLAQSDSKTPSSAERDVTQPRPNPAAAYHCGLNAIGKHCALGPTPSGRCCQEQWVVQCGDSACTKACQGIDHCQVGQLKHTGCEEERRDYLPCIPIKNSWYSRNNLAVNLAILSSGILLVCMAMPNNEVIFHPGELSHSHSQILGSVAGAARCSTCHPNSHGWSSNITQEQLCMNCHQSHMKDAIHGFPHDLPVEQFARLISNKASRLGDSSFEGGDTNSIASRTEDAHWRGIHTRCSQCHQEHHGDSRSLKAITDAKCQSCHEQQFKSFSHGHPEFTQLLSSNSRRIAFDHLAHWEVHFPKNNSNFDCVQCHQVDGKKGTEIVGNVGFQQACAACHEGPLRASGAEGWALIQLPSLNPEDLQIGGPGLVHWPSAARYGYDGQVTIAMQLLLTSDAEVAKAIAMFPEGDLSRVQADNPLQQAAARTIAIAVRQLLLETAEKGQAAWQRRLTELARNTLDRELEPTEIQLIQSMVSGLPPDLFRLVEDKWFSGRDGVVSYVDSPIAASLVSSQEQRRSNDSLLDDSSDSLLDDEEANELLRGSSTQGLQSNSLGKSLPSLAQSGSSDPIEPPANENRRKQRIGLQQLGQGGWYLDPRTYSIRYMLQGHADPVIASWIQFAALIESSQRPSAGSQDTQRTTQGFIDWHHLQMTVGQCTECHLLPNAEKNTLSPSDWASVKRNQGKRFTHFDHRPHLTLAGNTNCQTCHRIDKDREQRYATIQQQLIAASPADRDRCFELARGHFRGEFHTIEKAQCSSCHRPGGAPEGCTQCHHYHVDSVGTR